MSFTEECATNSNIIKRAVSNLMGKLQLKGFFKTLIKLKYLLVILVVFFLSFQNGTAQVTQATGGGALCAGFYSPLGNIVVAETANGDFATGTNVTLILTAPAGYDFNPAVGSVSVAGNNISAGS